MHIFSHSQIQAYCKKSKCPEKKKNEICRNSEIFVESLLSPKTLKVCDKLSKHSFWTT